MNSIFIVIQFFFSLLFNPFKYINPKSKMNERMSAQGLGQKTTTTTTRKSKCIFYFSSLGLFESEYYVLKKHYHSCDNIIDVPFYSIKCHEKVKMERNFVFFFSVSMCCCYCCLLGRSI